MFCCLKNSVLPPLASLVSAVLVTGVTNSVTLADQNAPELPGLFDQLLEATDGIDARIIEHEIWQHWVAAPDHSSELLMSQIDRAITAGELNVALTFCNQLVDSTPEFAEGWNRRATLHYLLGDDDSSVADIRETLILEPRHFGAISGLGLIFMRQNNLEAALKAFEQVLIISPESASARMNIEHIRNATGTEI